MSCDQFPNALPFVPPGRHHWSSAECHNVKLSPALRTDPADFPQGEGEDGFEQGFFEWITAHPVRAMSGDHDPTCRPHIGKMNMRNGFGGPVYCGQPREGDPRTRRNHWPQLHLQTEEDGADVAVGFFCWAGSLETLNTELHIHSSGRVCRGVT